MVRIRIPHREDRSSPLLTYAGDGGANAAMERYANGDDSAFAELYDAIAPRLLGFLCKATRDRVAAEDLMQQTFLQLHRARGSFVRGAPVMPWAVAIAKRLVIDGARRRRVELRLFITEAPADDDRVTPEPMVSASADEILDARRLERRMRRRIDALPENQRTAYQLVKQDG
jgi:RNA polymerase sigma-70 factor (ECF subfamily)